MRARGLSRQALTGATDVLHPLLTLARGLRRLAASARRKWTDTPKDRRSPLLFLVAAVVLVVVLVPYGPLLAAVSLMAAAAWAGREPAGPAAPVVDEEARAARLQSLHDALVPQFSVPEDPAPLYAHGGTWEDTFHDPEFDEDGRLRTLRLQYPAYFPDGDLEARARVERLLHAKSGRGREYHFSWDESACVLTLSVLPPLATGVCAQRWVTAPGERLLGLTDAGASRRTLPVTLRDGNSQDGTPVLWRTGPRSAEAHLLVVGQTGSGTTTLLRSLALQAAEHGDVIVVEGGGAGEYAFLEGHPSVLGVECHLDGALARLEWAAQETARRLVAANESRQAGRPAEAVRPLWVFLDRPSVLGHLAAGGPGGDPQSLLHAPLRYGRTAQVTVVVGEHFDGVDALGEQVLQHTRARVVLGRTNPAQMQLVLGAPPHTTPPDEMPPGRGWSRLGTGPVLRLQVPDAPDPCDETADAYARASVRALLTPATEAGDAPEEPGGAAGAEGAGGADGGHAAAAVAGPSAPPVPAEDTPVPDEDASVPVEDTSAARPEAPGPASAARTPEPRRVPTLDGPQPLDPAASPATGEG